MSRSCQPMPYFVAFSDISTRFTQERCWQKSPIPSRMLNVTQKSYQKESAVSWAARLITTEVLQKWSLPYLDFSSAESLETVGCWQTIISAYRAGDEDPCPYAEQNKQWCNYGSNYARNNDSVSSTRRVRTHLYTLTDGTRSMWVE